MSLIRSLLQHPLPDVSGQNGGHSDQTTVDGGHNSSQNGGNDQGADNSRELIHDNHEEGVAARNAILIGTEGADERGHQC